MVSQLNMTILRLLPYPFIPPLPYGSISCHFLSPQAINTCSTSSLLATALPSIFSVKQEALTTATSLGSCLPCLPCYLPWKNRLLLRPMPPLGYQIPSPFPIAQPFPIPTSASALFPSLWILSNSII